MWKVLGLAMVLVWGCGCSVLQTSIPLGNQAGAPVATATNFRLFWDASVVVSTPDGISLTYGSKPSDSAPMGSLWMKSFLDALTVLAHSQIAQAAMSGQMMGAGSGLPALPISGAALPAGTNASGLQQALQSAGCPLASKLSSAAFSSLLSALAQSGVALNVESLLPLLGGKK